MIKGCQRRQQQGGLLLRRFSDSPTTGTGAASISIALCLVRTLARCATENGLFIAVAGSKAR